MGFRTAPPGESAVLGRGGGEGVGPNGWWKARPKIGDCVHWGKGKEETKSGEPGGSSPAAQGITQDSHLTALSCLAPPYTQQGWGSHTWLQIPQAFEVHYQCTPIQSSLQILICSGLGPTGRLGAQLHPDNTKGGCADPQTWSISAPSSELTVQRWHGPNPGLRTDLAQLQA